MSDTAKSLRLPSFFIVGAPKCGTTAWVDYLETHPDIGFCSVKEPHHFSKDISGTKVADTWEKYVKLFDHFVTPPKVVADASVMHLYSKVAAEEIFKFNPDAKIVILLREHVSYLQSNHHQALYTGYEDEPCFKTAWELSEKRQLGENLPKHSTDASMVDYKALADFYPQVKRYVDVFPREQILVRWLDEWKSNPRDFYLELMAFLGLEDDGRSEFPKVHAAHAHRFQKIGELTAHPPGFVLKAAKIVKSILGIKRLGIAGRIRKSNTVENDKKEVPAELRNIIRERYKDDRQKIESLLD